jgi:signal transduction histidine kinase
VSQIAFGEKNFNVYSLYDIKAELEENEVESWQKLIRVLTHEIMNSIAPITSLSKTLQRLLHSDDKGDEELQVDLQVEKAKEGLSVIEETGKGLMHFIDNYRRLTKIPKPVFKTVIIKDWLNRVLLLMKEHLEEEHITMELVFKTKQKEFLADEKLLTQVIINILKNAIEASKNAEKKKIILSTKYDSSGNLELSITDHGKGIPEDEMDKIFIPFYTTKENGSGVGLSISRQIMRLHKASLSATSKVGKGTTFFLRF